MKFAIPILAFAFFSGSISSPKAVPVEDTAKITGKAIPDAKLKDKFLNVSVYNGSEWKVTHLDISVTNNKTKQSRIFRHEIQETFYIYDASGKPVRREFKRGFIAPLTQGDVSVYIDDFLVGSTAQGDWSWNLGAAQGFKD